MKAPNETALVKDCIEFLRHRGIWSWRNNTGSIPIGEGTGRRFFRAGLKGSADILGIVPPLGRLLAVECKMPGKKPSMDQLAFGAGVHDAGGLYFVVHSLDELDELLTENGI